MVTALVLVLLSMLFPGAAIGKEASAVFAYTQETGPAAENHVLYDVSRKGKDDAITKTRTACEAHAKQQRAANTGARSRTSALRRAGPP